MRSVFLSYDWHKYDQTIGEFTAAFARLSSESIMFVVKGGVWAEPRLTVSGDQYEWNPPTLHLGSLATLQQAVFVPATWAHPRKQPIMVTKKFQEIKEFQGDGPVRVNTPEELTTFISQMRRLVFNAGIASIGNC